MTTDEIGITAVNIIISFLITLLTKHYVTKVVESVKLENSTQLEKIKTKLGLVSKTYEVVYDDERKAIIEFIGAVTDFFESNINIPNEYSTPEGLAYIQERIRVLDNDYGKVQIASSKLNLFCFNEQILEVSKPVLMDLAHIQGETQVFRFKYLGSLKISSIVEQKYYSGGGEETLKQFKETIDEQTQIQQDFNDRKLEFIKDYIVKYNSLLDICKSHLETKKAIN